jgi:hypothetical protein
MSDFKKIIKYSEVSKIMTGGRNTIRVNRPNVSHSKALEELYDFLEGWVERNSLVKENIITIKTK